MVTNDLCINAFERIKKVVHSVVEGLPEDKLTAQPTEDANTIAWLVWHLTRIQDDHIADVAEKPQAWTDAGWAKKFDLPFTDTATGYGQNAEDVAAVQVSAELLLGYYDAVHEQTITFISKLTEADYEKVVDTNWDPPVTLAVRLVSVISDDLQHAGQAAYARGLM